MLRSNKCALIRDKIEELAAEPLALAANVKRLKGRIEYRLRVQDWRVIFRIEGELLYIDEHCSAWTSLRGLTMMTAQIVEIAGQKLAVLPIAEYERLLDMVEDKADEFAAANAEHRRIGGEEYIPAEIVDRILAGESALRVWRRYRAMTLDDVAKQIGVTVATISRLETGVMRGHPTVWRKLADVLGVSVEDVLPA